MTQVLWGSGEVGKLVIGAWQAEDEGRWVWCPVCQAWCRVFTICSEFSLLESSQKGSVNFIFKNYGSDFPGSPVAKTVLPVQGTQVQSLVKELDPTYCT